MNKICSLCGKNPRAKSSHSYCNLCHNKKTREWRKTHPLTEEQRRRDTARSYASVYLKRGKIKRMPCEVCGEKAQMHHPDYSKPTKVKWFCRKHHIEKCHKKVSRPHKTPESE